MPRVGRHPLKTKDLRDVQVVYQPVTVTTIVHIPTISGYWEESLEVLKLFFQSLFENTSQPFDLMVFDNGSCEEVLAYLLELRRAGKIQYLILSRQNLRKLGALNFLLSAAPGDFIAYADSDVYFLPGWLDESLKVLEAFPEAGKVTALPIVGGDTTRISKSVFDTIQNDPTITVETGILVPEKFVEAHRMSLGQSSEAYAERIKNRKDTLLKRNNTKALLSGADFHFVITRKAVWAVLPLQVEKLEEYYDPIYTPVLEHCLERAGFWQLSTTDYLVHHLGNHLPEFGKELSWASHINPSLSINGDRSSQMVNKDTFLRRLMNTSMMRRYLNKLYTLSYRLLYEKPRNQME
jgi:glycosyltransferase involved in cell wall biosynthesis